MSSGCKWLTVLVACSSACAAEPAKTVTVVACAADGTCPSGRLCKAGVCEVGAVGADAASQGDTGGADATASASNDSVGKDATGKVDAAAVCDPDPSYGPTARGDVSTALVGGKLLVLYGDEGAPIQCNSNPKYVSDAHIFDPCKGWELPKSTQMPTPRARAASVYDRDHDSLWMFGGRFRQGSSGPYTNYSDLWVYSGGDGQFQLIDEGKTGPSARSNSCMGYQRQSTSLWLFGGNTSTNGLNFMPLADLWRFDAAAAQWSKVATKGTGPSPRLFHACAVGDDGKALVVYGGGGANAFIGPFYGDTFVLDLESLTWSTVQGPAPMARIKPGLAAAPNGSQIWLFGGHDDGAVGNRNDLWSFSLTTKAWTVQVLGDLGAAGNPDVVNKPANAFCDFPPDFMQLDKISPERREAMGFSADSKGNLWMFGGKSDCGVLRDVWKYDITTSKWENIDDTTTGWSCDRFKKPCSTLCN
ncbi:MAG: hypothetical protein EXR77_09340 [Myxococcales bacterium]|nr:hypothetical protein [Myxococcales bacterium]